MAGVRQHGWIVMHGSVRHPVGQRFHSDDTVAGVRSIFPLTRGQVIRGPRYHALSGGTAPMIAFIQAILGAYRLCAKLLIAGGYNSIDEKDHSNRFIYFVNVICFQSNNHEYS